MWYFLKWEYCLAAGDYDYAYRSLEITRNVVEVLEKARKDAGFGF